MKKRVVFGLSLIGILMLSLLSLGSVDAVLSGHACYDAGFRVYQKDLPGCTNIDCTKCETATGSPCIGTPAPTYYDCKTSEWNCNLLNIAEIKPEDFECKTSGKYVEVYMGKSSMTTLVPVEKIKGYYITYPDACIQGARFFERWDTNFKKCVEIVDGKEIYHGFLIGNRCSTDTDIVSVSDTEFGQTAIKYQRCSGWCPPPHVFSCSPLGSPVTESGCQKDGEVCYNGWDDINKNGESEETKGNCYSDKCSKICPEGTTIEGKPCKVCDGMGGEKNAPNGINCVAPGNLDGFCQNGECVVACPLPTITGASTGTITLPPCKKCDDKGNIVADPLQNGKECSLSDGKVGYCLNGDCKEKNCQNLFGLDFQNCGSGPGLKCCYSGKCCENNICCKKNEACKTFFGNALCSPTNCSDGFKLCPGKTQNWCCPKQDVCLTWNGGGGWESAECGKNQCGSGEIQCPTGKNPFKGGVLCCNNEYEYCDKDPKHGYPFCEAKNNQSGYSFCQGTGKYSWRKRWCKDGVETCAWQPKGYPYCVNIGIVVGKQSQTRSTSIYMIRNNNLFTLNGIAYAITPYINFNEPVNITIDYPAYPNQEILDTYKYSSHESVLGICNSAEISKTSNIIGISGDTINLNNEIIMQIPSGALKELTIINITKYNLSECYQPGAHDNKDAMLEAMNNLCPSLYSVLSSLNSWAKNYGSLQDSLSTIEKWINC